MKKLLGYIDKVNTLMKEDDNSAAQIGEKPVYEFSKTFLNNEFVIICLTCCSPF